MSRSLIRGSSQILSGSIFDAQIAAAAAIQTSKLADGAEFLRRDGSVALTGNLDGGGNRLTNLAAGTGNNDAVTLAQLEAVASGYDPKESVRVATTGADIDLTSGGLLTLDGVALQVGDRVLVKDQTDATENGIYTAAAGAWTRSEDMDGTPVAEVSGGVHTYVESGTTNAGVGYAVIHDGNVDLGVDDVVWSQQSGAGSFTAGAGLTQTGNVLDVNAGNAIEIIGDNVTVHLDGGTLAKSASGLKLADLPDGQILIGSGSNEATGHAVSGDIGIDNTGVVTIASGAVTNAKIAAGAAIESSKLQDGDEFLQRDGSVVWTGNQNAGNQKITNLQDGTASQDAATFGQLGTITGTIQSELDATQAGAGLAADGSYAANAGSNYLTSADFTTATYSESLNNADLLLDAAIKQVADDLAAIGGGSLTAMQAEIDAIENGIGLASDGTYVSPVGTNYIDASISVMSAITAIDSALAAIDSEVTGNDSDIVDLQAELDATQSGAGLAIDGTFVSYSGTNFIDASTSLANAVSALDSGISTALDDKLDDSQLIDDDTMATATSTNIPSAESIKTYVDDQLSAETIGFVDDEDLSAAIDGVNTGFTVTGTPEAGSVKLFFNGQRLREGATNDFTLLGSTITTLFVPEAGDQLWVDYRVA